MIFPVSETFLHAWVLSWFSRVWLFATLWTVACQAPLSMGFSRQEYWRELPFPPPDPGIQPTSLMSPALAGRFFTTNANWWAPETCLSESESRSVVSDSLWPHGLYGLWNSPGQNTGVGSPSLLQVIFPTQGSNPGLLHCSQILYQLSYKKSTREGRHSYLPLIYLDFSYSVRRFYFAVTFPRHSFLTVCMNGLPLTYTS